MARRRAAASTATPRPAGVRDHAAMPDPIATTGLRLLLHGQAVVLLPDGRSVALERRAAALLALAALEPGIGRLRVATMLWPDSADPRRNLRQQLLRFRQTYARELTLGNETLALADGVTASLDDENSAATLLQTHDFEDCPEFAQWLSRQRAARHDRRLNAARQQLASSEAAGDLDAALAAAHALLALDGQAESHHRELMRLHYLRGDTAAGLAAYRRLSDMLAADFSTRPSPASEQLAATLRTTRPGETSPSNLASRPALPVTLKRPPLLVGREAERAAVLQHWAEGRAVLLEGEAGLGKSRLLAELLRDTTPRARLCACGRPGDTGAPYATLARLLRPLLDEGAAGLDTGTRDTLAYLAPMAGPEAATLRPGAMARAVTALLQQREVRVVAVDDLHFADDATVELIAGLVAQAERGRRWLLAARPAEVSATTQALSTSLAELRQLATVTLAPLDEGAIGTLVDTLAVRGLVGSTLAGPLLRHTGGNPLFLLETLKQGLADGSLARGELPRPLSVGALIERRLQRLSEPALTLARVAAIAGVDFSIELAESAIGVRAVQLASAWGELQDAQVLRDEAFAHDLVCDAVLRGVPLPVARRLHADVAAFLKTHRGDPARLALHWEAAGRWAEAREALLSAASGARAAGRYVEQGALLQRAATACERLGDRHAGFEVLIERVQALVLCDDGDAALEAAAALESQAGTDVERLHAIACHANLRGLRMESEAALALGERGLALAEQLGDQAVRLDLCCTLSYVLSVLGRNAEAMERLESMREWVHTQGSPTECQHWTTHMALVSTALGRLREAVRLHEASAALAEQLNLLPELSMDYSNLSDAYSAIGLHGQAAHAARRAATLAQEHGSGSGMVARIELALAKELRNDNRYAEALSMFERWQAGAHQEASPVWQGVARVWWAGLWLRLGQHARALQLLRDDDEEGLDRIRALGWIYRSQIERATGQPWHTSLQRARELFDQRQGWGLAQGLTRLALLAPAEALKKARTLGLLAHASERIGTLVHARVCEAEAAAALGLRPEVRSAAQDALHWLSEGYTTDNVVCRSEMYWATHQALRSVGEDEAAARALKLGLRWLQEQALPHVPAPFMDSFLHRNPAVRGLLAAARANHP